MTDPNVLGGWLFGLAAGAYGAYQGWRSNKVIQKHEANTEVISDAKKHAERAEAMAKMSEEYKTLFEREHKELSAYREETHENNKKTQALLFEKESRITELSARPDLTELLKHFQDQGAISSTEHTRILAVLEQIMLVLQSFIQNSKTK